MSEEVEALIAENRRLREESDALRTRLDAFERSRWWRLHPRFLLQRVRPPQAAARVDDPAVEADAGEHAGDDQVVVSEFRAEVVARGSFSQDWLTYVLPRLDPIVAAHAGRRTEILEIGSFEGLSTCYFLWRLPDAHVTSVDTFAMSLEHAALETAEPLERTFDRNVAMVDESRVRKRVGDSRRVLLDLAEEGAAFDLVYVDGSHLALDVLVDAALAWRLLRGNGTLIFDDYRWTDLGEDPLLRPGPAIDAFLGLLDGRFELLLDHQQLAVRKTA